MAVPAIRGLANPHGDDRPKAAPAYRAANKYFDEGKFRNAVGAYRMAILRDPEFFEARYNLALASEMVDRKMAIGEWKGFLDAAAGQPKYAFDVVGIRARIKTLESRPDLPEPLRPDQYEAGAGDYFTTISHNSRVIAEIRFPLTVHLGDPPYREWEKAARKAVKDWSSVFPIKVVGSRVAADFVVGWEDPDFEEPKISREDTGYTIYMGRSNGRTSNTSSSAAHVSDSWSEALIRAFVAHQLGHALGIKGHSDNEGDIMFRVVQAQTFSLVFTVGPQHPSQPNSSHTMMAGRLTHRPTRRDINTLIRLYSNAGPCARLR